MLWYCPYLKDDEIVRQITSYAIVSSRNLALSSALFVAAAASFFFLRRNKRVFFIAIVGLTSLWVIYYANKLLYFSDRAHEYPQIPAIAKLKELAGTSRVWSYGDAYISRNIPSYWRLYSPEGYEALFSYRYAQLLSTIQSKGMLGGSIERTDATLSETGQFEVMPSHPWRMRLLSLLGVKYILEYKGHSNPDRPFSERFPEDEFFLSWEDGTWRIWEYKKALPRAFFASDYQVETDDQKLIDALYSPSTDLANTVLLEEKPQFSVADGPANATVDINKYEPESVTLTVQSDRDGLVFLSDTYYPGWNATVDGKEAKIYRANFVFRAVVVPRGSHTITFIYDPLSWKIGVAVSTGSLVGLIGYIALTLRRRSWYA